MTKESLDLARNALQIGIENTQELLDQRDAQFGRTTRSNKLAAERLELEIEQMRTAAENLLGPTAANQSVVE